MQDNVVQIREKEMEAGYVDVDLDRGQTIGASETVSIAAAEEWEKQLLSNPKVGSDSFNSSITDHSRIVLRSPLSSPILSIPSSPRKSQHGLIRRRSTSRYRSKVHRSPTNAPQEDAGYLQLPMFSVSPS